MLKPVIHEILFNTTFPLLPIPAYQPVFQRSKFRRLFSSFMDLRYLSAPSLKTQSRNFERQAVSNYLQICKR